MARSRQVTRPRGREIAGWSSSSGCRMGIYAVHVQQQTSGRFPNAPLPPSDARNSTVQCSEQCSSRAGLAHGPMGRTGHGPGLGLQFDDINGLRTGPG